MATPPPTQSRRSGGDSKKVTPPTSNIVTRNGARKAKIQTRAMSAAAKPSASLIAAKKKAQQKKKQNHFVMEIRDHFQIAMESKTLVKGPTGFVTEPRMGEHRCLWDENYPECPERLISVIKRCQELNLVQRCKHLEPRAATKEELCVLHAPSVYEMLETTHGNDDAAYLEELSSKFDAIYIHPSTHELALISAGSTIDMVDSIVSGEVQNGAAFVRPPGHHAMHSEPCGYCFYNNVALAAKHALDKRGLQRILIVDWDVHHGQATQQMFYDDPRVVYFSIHRYEHGSFWPQLRQSDFHYVGSGAGKGYNFNVPLNKTGMKDGDYLAIWHQLLLPMAYEYQPELIIVSAGYDAAIGCPEGEMEVSPACYAVLLHALQSVTSRVCVVLEGGYCLTSLAEGAALTLRTLLGDAPPKLEPPTPPCDSIRDTILDCIYAHRQYWSCYSYQPARGDRHEVLVRWRGDETRPSRFATRDCYPTQDEPTRRALEDRLDHLRAVTDLTSPTHAVGYVYDEAMLKHRNVVEPGHVESPERIMRIHERHRDFGLLERLHRLPGRAASDQEILSVHSDKYLDRLKELASTKLRDLNNQKEEYDSVYFHPESLSSAAVAAGCVLQAVEAVVSGQCGAAACVVRPPGHHAARAAPAGFCLLNNAALAARAAHRVLLLDWDVHHGNGTQALTYTDDQILYISIHRYDHGSFFPHSKDADYTAVGTGRGEGYNINIPWNKRGMGDAEYMAAFTQVVLPIAHEYNPDLVIVSAGFDACVGDPLGGCKVTPECYGRMTQLLRGLAGGRVVLCLEGGYNTTAISYAMTMCTKALLGDPILHHYEPRTACHWSAVETINNVISTHKKYWKSLAFQLALPSEDVLQRPAPSRGLSDLSDALSSSYEDTKSDSKSGSQLDTSLEHNMANLSLNKCGDGVHCGTDDEDEAGDTASNSNPESTGNTKSLVDYLSENMQALVEGEMFAVVPLGWCPHLEALYAIPAGVRFQQGLQCVDCEHTLENWVCLHCYITACARGVNAHMQAHWAASGHALVLSLRDLSVWCCACDAYVDHPLLYDAKNNAHRCKFGEDMPWCYAADAVEMH
ncbi:histone deacetylase 6 isoform X1 [Bombyx mori]|uniref:UBP-type domain-containing protein n=1 Tax=Bombyx mori TaxID=7091 RepID=A0A8R2G7E0_BOMMO|nr:histone deacetylase 6 isoform X1 [Bombyx mori]